MVAENREDTALGSAHGRFLESLPRKAIELRGAVALLSETPGAEGPREDMRRRLHALYASALVFRDDVLAQAVHEGIERLDAVREQGRGLERPDLELLTSLVKRLPELHGNGASAAGRAHTPVALAADAPAAPAGDAARARSRRDPEQPLLQRVLQVLLLAAEHERDELLALLRSDSLHVSCVDDLEQLLASVHADAPDLVLANEQLARAVGLIRALRADAVSDAIPIVLFEGEAQNGRAGVRGEHEREDARVPRPFGAAQLVEAIGRATGTLIEAIEPARVGEVTLDQLAERVAREVRRGLIDSAARGRAASVAFGDDADALAAVYGAVAELRAAVVRASGGAVQFEAHAQSGAPALTAFEGAQPLGPDEQLLHGRRVLLVEADTAIVLLLANVLREQGASVQAFTDGREAREAARRERPDLVIAGARAPSLDAFALCRELRRDPLLADVPLLLLPPREQLLTRVKEPATTTQLQGELAAQVVRSAERLLRARAELEAKLNQPGELRGSLEGSGVIALLRGVRRARPDARVTVRDSWNLFECELREGRLAQVTRTASDGSFVRNERALPQLLGATAGRFTVVDADGPMKVSFEGTLDEVLMRGARELAAELDAVSLPRLGRVARIVFDEDAYALLAQQTPPVVREVIERLYAGEAPSKLLKGGQIAVDTLEPILLDMARRGALRGVIGSAGEDLVAEARAARAEELPTELASPLSLVPPPPNPVISVLPAAEGAAQAAAARAEAAELPLPAPTPVRAPLPEVVVDGNARGRGREASVTEASELAAAAAEARRSRGTLAAWTVALMALAAGGIFVAREPEGGAMPEALGGAPVARPTGPGPREPGGSMLVAEDQGFAVYDGILEAPVPVPADRALLVIEASPALESARIFVNDRELGPAPQHVPLPEGVHELAIKRGDAISYRFVTVHPGRTWVLRQP